MEATKLYQNALEIIKVGRWGDSLPFFQQAAEAGIDDAIFHYNYGTALLKVVRYADALPHLHRCTQLDPTDLHALNNLAITLMRLNHIVVAEAVLRRILAIQPGNTEVISNLALCLMEQGQTREAVDCYRQVLAVKPGYPEAISNLLLGLHYHETDGHRIRTEHETLARHLQTASPDSECPPDIGAMQARTDKGRIRIGFVSPDFRMHSVAYFAAPLIACLDRAQFEVFCYSNTAIPDAVTRDFERLVDGFRPIYGKTNAEVARLVRTDRISVLIDLAGHTADGRPGLFGLRPAPVQAAWLGYPATMGIAAVEWRITDGIADPKGFDSFYTECLLRLPTCFLCYRASSDAPAASPPPSTRNGFITFGSFNNAAKIQPETVGLWAAVLAIVPNSRMLLKAKSFVDENVATRFRKLFGEEGIDPARLDMRALTGDFDSHLAMYGDIDIALDTWPYNGTTTTCEAIFMGVPVVTLSGPVHASNVGASLLRAIGLPSLSTDTPQAFVRTAALLAADPALLSRLRTSLRTAMIHSPLCDATRFAADFGMAVGTMLRSNK